MQAHAHIESRADPVSKPTGPLTPAEHLFREHHGRVYRAAYRVTGSASDAEDVLQTVFLRLLKRDPFPDLAPNPERYLQRAAVNAALDVVRARPATAELAEARLVDQGGTPDRVFEAGDLRKRLRQALARLLPRHAEMFVLHHFEGHDLATIARLVGTSRGVVAVTLFRTRLRLKNELNQQGGM